MATYQLRGCQRQQLLHLLGVQRARAAGLDDLLLELVRGRELEAQARGREGLRRQQRARAERDEAQRREVAAHEERELRLVVLAGEARRQQAAQRVRLLRAKPLRELRSSRPRRASRNRSGCDTRRIGDIDAPTDVW